MKVKVIRVLMGLGLIAGLAVGLSLAWPSHASNSPPSIQAAAQLSVDAVIQHPQRFSGPIAVSGRVAQVEPRKGWFTLGCADECVAMPVKFAGALPAVGSQVTVRGQIQQVRNGRYLFAAKTVVPK